MEYETTQFVEPMDIELKYIEEPLDIDVAMDEELMDFYNQYILPAGYYSTINCTT